MINLAFVGDIAVGAKLPKIPKDVISKLKSAIAIGNLEGPITPSTDNVRKSIIIKQNLNIGKFLKERGISRVLLANNHSLDYGLQGFTDTLASLQKDGLEYIGGGRNLTESTTPFVFSESGSKVAVYNISTTLPLESGASINTPGIAPLKVRCTIYVDPTGEQEQPGTPPISKCFVDHTDITRIKKQLEVDKKNNTISIVTFHWGMPYQYNIMDYQREISESLFKSGCSLIIGHHPHVVQEAERFGSKWVFYSIGNFIWLPNRKYGVPKEWLRWPPQYGTWGPSNESIIVSVEIIRNKIKKIGITPLVLDGGVPSIANNAQKKAIQEKLKVPSLNL